MISTPTLLRPGLAAATRTGSLSSVMARAASPFAPCPCPHARFMSMAKQALVSVAPLTPYTPCTSYTSYTPTRQASSFPSHRPAPQTGASLNSDAAADAAAAASIAKASSANAKNTRNTKNSPVEGPPLDWNTFFQLRKTRRRIQMVFSGVGGIVGGLAGGLFLGSGIAEPLLGQIPLDPFVTLGLMTFGFSALGWLVGPSMGNAVFYTWKRQFRQQMTTKEVQFFARVKKNRVDPTNSSAGNPVPDFYGEKISSVAGYRQWLKDQRAFNKKRTTFV
ncbi:presequence translocase-associated motor subunit [Ophiostoma piceae UAMH 11346]|uniref:Presequence translocated-associated motor subunit PAM17 n=1 Tax=Ophiostoma piceae (strain UAMH 11346) TaxID=1262450 RepID=S3BSJ5_OPHP1|nr:presequence translocase-associated motor subunit [Ophiostoma piceae UAMH 11346]